MTAAGWRSRYVEQDHSKDLSGAMLISGEGRFLVIVAAAQALEQAKMSEAQASQDSLLREGRY